MGDTTTIAVPFHSCVGGEVDLTWGQANMWRAVERFGGAAERFNLPRWRLLSRPVPLARAVKAIRVLVERRQVLRTRFVTGADGPRQQVATDGTHRVTVVPVPRSQARRIAVRTTAELATGRIDLARDWPVRFCLLVERHAVVGVAFVASHVALDGWATDRLLADLLHCLDGRHRLRPERYGPIEHARHEAVGIRSSTRAYLEKCLRSVRPSVFATLVGEADLPRFHAHTLRSTTIVSAARTIADRCGTSTAAVFLAATAAALAASCADRQVPIKIITSNRFTPRYRSLAAAMAQDALAVVPLGDTDFDETVRLAYRSATIACCHSRYPPDEFDRLRARIEAAADTTFDLSAYFNDARTMQPDGRAVEPPLPRGRSAETGGVLTRLDGLDDNDMRFYLRITSAGTAYDLLLVTDSHLFSATGSARLLRGIERLLLAAATGPVPDARMAALTGATPL
ncbi:condensation domain-containing protein [Micromonospora sp. NPDC047134]|uniref:condensation domain-containing protein n=1 Tax=Micromonospora sp. NPDC047134 TaxID=3154340 RepID=UPI0033D5C7E0